MRRTSPRVEDKIRKQLIVLEEDRGEIHLVVIRTVHSILKYCAVFAWGR